MPDDISVSECCIELENERAQILLGERLARALDYCGIVYLIGDLGAGKTTLARGAVRSLGHEGAVKSPTYTLVEPYLIGPYRLYHFDLYRLGDPEELEFMGAREMLAETALSLIEWPSRGLGWLPGADLTVSLSLQTCGRIAHISGHSEHGRYALERLSKDESRP